MKKVAILVPTIDRIDFVLRMIKYYASINCSHPIFIGDASSKSSKELVLKTAQNNVEIYYFHWKSLGGRKTIIKLAQEANKADVSEFCAFHGDDDFFIAESLSKCADFLHNNNEYSSAQGRAFCFKLNQKGPYGDLKDIGIYWNKNELNGDTALDRLKCISLNYWVPIFSVSRTTDFIHNMSVGVDSVIDTDFGEYVNVFSIAMSGKSKFIDCLYLARQVHNQNHLSSSKFEWISSENWHVSYTGLLNSLSEVLSNNDNIKLTESRNEINQSIKRVIGLENEFSLRKFLLTKYSEYIDKKRFIYLMSIFYRKIKYSYILSFKDFSRRDLMSYKSIYYKDVYSIINICKKRH
jgi:glycosyltransferase domain-containing protein